MEGQNHLAVTKFYKEYTLFPFLIYVHCFMLATLHAFYYLLIFLEGILYQNTLSKLEVSCVQSKRVTIACQIGDWCELWLCENQEIEDRTSAQERERWKSAGWPVCPKQAVD